MKKSSGIYCIFNKINAEIYIGSSKNISNRISSHKYKLNSNTHDNPYLQNAWNKYGVVAFEFKIIEICSIEKLIECEQYWIDFYDSANPEKGYNIVPKADHSEMSLETRQKMSKLKKGKISNFKGKYHTEEAKEKNRLAHLGHIGWNTGKRKITQLECVICEKIFIIIWPNKIRKTCSLECKSALNSINKKGKSNSKKGKKFALRELIFCKCGCGEQFEDRVSQHAKFKNVNHYNNFQISKQYLTKKVLI